MKKSREQIEKYLSGKTEENENFPVSSFLISKRYKKHIRNLYLFARNADDIADNSFLEPSKKKKILLQFDEIIKSKTKTDYIFLNSLIDTLNETQVSSNEVIEPTVIGMAQEGNTYTGFLYAGLMIMSDGSPKVIEYNCRFGDPETQPIMMRLESDLLDLCNAVLDKKLSSHIIKWDTRAALGIVIAAGGYPNKYKTGDVITGLPLNSSNNKVFHAGTSTVDGNVVTSGGRVLCAVGLGTNISCAREEAYKIAKEIHWEGSFFRDDIGYRAIERER